MKYRVIWQPFAKDLFKNIWLKSTDHAAIKSAAITIESELSKDPHHVGEGRQPGFRIIMVSPLSAYYMIDDMKRTVTVVSVFHRLRRK